jgi:hypothetical protein
VSGCGAPDFIKRATSDEPASVAEPVNVQVTPRELLTARLVNPPANENTPPITVGKLIEFADRYLSCDCSGTRFVKAWQRLPDGYRLETNSEQIHPLDFACNSQGDTTNCYLSEIDRGAHVLELEERFVPGAEFIRFMYENGLRCEREEPCPIAEEPGVEAETVE